MLEDLEHSLHPTPFALGALAGLLLAIDLAGRAGYAAWGHVARRTRVHAALKAALRQRTRVGALVLLWCLLEGLLHDELPWNPVQANLSTSASLLLVVCGLSLRVAALGVIRKAEALATTGVYSACRHPLYLGTVLIAFGICILYRDNANTFFAGAYFLAFYPLTMAKEEWQNDRRFGTAHSAYRASTPLLIPLGQWREPAGFQWMRAFLQGARTLAWLLAAYAAAWIMVELRPIT